MTGTAAPSATSVVPTDSSPAAVADAVAGAAEAAAAWSRTLPAERARGLRAVADALAGAADELIELAALESHLTVARLTGELGRTTFQLRFLAEVVEEGSFLEAIIDTPDPHHPIGPRPDLRRMMLPLGPIAMFAASNFPFAFSVAGGDTAAALAAGCPVVVKAHPGHPLLSARTGTLVQQALSSAGAPDGVFSVVHGVQAGIDLLQHDRITGAAFTGSVHGGRALADIAAARPTPIPFYGELGSINPAYVTAAAVAARGQSIVEGFVASFTLGVGQFCTKPGVLFVPAGSGLEPAIIAAATKVGSAPMLAGRLAAQHGELLAALTEVEGVRTLAAGIGDELSWSPTVLATDAATVLAHPAELLGECFGPTSLLVEYDDLEQLPALTALVPGSLTATVHAEPEDTAALKPLLEQLTGMAGRVLWNGWPTGVAVSWAQHHGGPYPATTVPGHTSVGSTSIRRFQRPVSYQSMPAELLPVPLRDGNGLGIPRRINGTLSWDDVTA